jgi:hypothetical protein
MAVSIYTERLQPKPLRLLKVYCNKRGQLVSCIPSSPSSPDKFYHPFVTVHFTAVFSEKPLKIITGRGAHSAKGKSVLKPAIKNALHDDGWIVDVWDGGLLVRGKRGAPR